MRVLWLTNRIPGTVQQHMGANASDGLWVDRVLQGLRETDDLTVRVLSMGMTDAFGEVDAHLSYRTFREKSAYRYEPALEKSFCGELRTFQPDVIHIWGTEYGHTLAMVNAAAACGQIHRTVVSIQGLCSVIARHCMEGLPASVLYGFTLRDVMRLDNPVLQRRKFARRGALEIAALRQVRHVSGRTPWDRACTGMIHPEREYHFCNETLREAFYSGTWEYEACRKHRIFASSCMFPLKGFHYLLEAFEEVLKVYPDATISVPGRSFLHSGARSSRYENYLAGMVRKMHADDKIVFCGNLNAQQMREEYLRANVFVMPSAIENSPNSLGEAMLLGVPCVAADVGGASAMLRHGQEGFLYQSTAPYMLAQYILDVFAMQDRAEELGRCAAEHARATHDAQKNLQRLMEIYQTVCADKGEDNE